MQAKNMYDGDYTMEEVRRILESGERPYQNFKPSEAFYKKSFKEHGPTWKEKRDVSFLVPLKIALYSSFIS